MRVAWEDRQAGGGGAARGGAVVGLQGGRAVPHVQQRALPKGHQRKDPQGAGHEVEQRRLAHVHDVHGQVGHHEPDGVAHAHEAVVALPQRQAYRVVVPRRERHQQARQDDVAQALDQAAKRHTKDGQEDCRVEGEEESAAIKSNRPLMANPHQ